MRFQTLLILSFSIFASGVSANLTINEIMYDPFQSDHYNEWVELYNPGNYSLDLTKWTLCGDELLSGYVNHTDGKIYLNMTMTIPAKGYAIITDGGSGTAVYENFNVNSNSYGFHVSSSSICQVLNNKGETITLKDRNGTLIDSVDYTAYTSYAKGNNKTLERVNLTDTWVESTACGGTPGFENSVKTLNQPGTQPDQSEQQIQSKSEIENKPLVENNFEKSNKYPVAVKSIESRPTKDNIKIYFLGIILLLSVIVVGYKLIYEKSN